MSSDTFQLQFLYKKQIAKNTFSFYFDRKNIPFDFLPGQYLTIQLPIQPKDGSGSSRKFTIASSPLNKEFLVVTTKKGQGEFKKALFALECNEYVTATGPLGGFILKDTDTYDHVFIAGGIGITPFYSMIAYVAEKKLSIPITLIASFSSREEEVFYDELMNMGSNNKNRKIVFITGNISNKVIKKYVPNVSAPTYYIVGPPRMVEGTEELLEKMGIESEKIKVEEFTGYETIEL